MHKQTTHKLPAYCIVLIASIVSFGLLSWCVNTSLTDWTEDTDSWGVLTWGAQSWDALAWSLPDQSWDTFSWEVLSWNAIPWDTLSWWASFSALISLIKQWRNLCVDGNCFSIEVADTPELRARWLMEREFLPADHGMLFVFDRWWSWSFWMKNTLISLDMLRLDKSWTIIHIEESVPPCEEIREDFWWNCPSYGPPNGSEARYVVELAWWSAESLAIGEWDSFVIERL